MSRELHNFIRCDCACAVCCWRFAGASGSSKTGSPSQTPTTSRLVRVSSAGLRVVCSYIITLPSVEVLGVGWRRLVVVPYALHAKPA